MTAATTTNPLREGLRLARTPEPATLVIFGGSGDLATRKLMPALYDLAHQRLLPAAFTIVGTARARMTDEAFREEIHQAVAQYSRLRPINDELWASFAQRLRYVTTADPIGYGELAQLLDRIDATEGTGGNRLFYLATPPAAYLPIIEALGAHQIAHRGGWSRIVVEKPFGRDLGSAQLLTAGLSKVFAEDEIFRIDHYLGKETVQNILVHRFANGIFEPIWNRQYVDSVQITVAESIGIEDRGNYYEQAGAIRDIVSNHLLQLLTLVAMEPPVAFDADAVRDEKVKILRSLRPIAPQEVGQRTVRAQYGAGYVEGERVPAYRTEDHVDPQSETETYVALTCYIDSWRWEGTPFYLRTGKRLPKRATEIAVQFRAAPHQLFGGEAAAALEPNALVIRVQPDEGISLKIGAKVPVQGIRIRSVNMDFEYGAAFVVDAPDAYETLILDALRGDATLFTRRDEVEHQWRFVDPIVDGWTRGFAPIATYDSGTWGPTEADLLLARHGRTWRKP